MVSTIIGIFIAYLILIFYFNLKHPEIRWNWKKINTSNLNFPKYFFWGTASAAHQVEGNCNNNNWYKWENSIDENGTPRIKNNQKSGNACNHWNLYKEDIELIKKLGVSHYRISIEWSKIQPNKNEFDTEAIHHYSEVINNLIANNITPVITLHHFTNPIWFDKMGGFEKEENIHFFVNFCKKIFSLYSKKVKLWCTINEPGVYAFMGYFMGMFPPGTKNIKLAITVLTNLLIAHTRVYYALKKLPNGKHNKIGIVKNIMQFDPYRRWHFLDWIVCKITNKVYNKMTLSYLEKGRANIYIPFIINHKYEDKQAAGATDFFGLNYYSHIHLKFQLKNKEFLVNKYLKNDIMTDMPYAMYPEGFYRAIKLVSKLNKPILITENGVADKKDNIRSLFISRYIYAMNKAINEGVNVIGYFYWTLMDNFEWVEGYNMKFGLYKVNFSTQKRELREGSKTFIKIINETKK